MAASRALERGREGPQSVAAGTQQALQTIPAVHWENTIGKESGNLVLPSKPKSYETRKWRCKYGGCSCCDLTSRCAVECLLVVVIEPQAFLLFNNVHIPAKNPQEPQPDKITQNTLFTLFYMTAAKSCFSVVRTCLCN